MPWAYPNRFEQNWRYMQYKAGINSFSRSYGTICREVDEKVKYFPHNCELLRLFCYAPFLLSVHPISAFKCTYSMHIQTAYICTYIVRVYRNNTCLCISIHGLPFAYSQSMHMQTGRINRFDAYEYVYIYSSI